jgi:hypothetical protein
MTMMVACLLFLSTLQFGVGLQFASPHSVKPVTKVVYIKTHSTGSSTLTGILHRYCDSHGLRCFVHPKGMSPGHTIVPKELANIAQHMEITNQTIDIWPNHAVLEPDIFDAMIPGNMKISIFRNPLDRVLSSFGHGSADKIRNNIRQLTENRGGDQGCGIEGRKMSLHVPVDKFDALDFVLLTEQFDLGLIMMQRRFAWSKSDIMYLRLKDHTHDSGVQEALSDLKAHITGHNQNMTGAARELVASCIEGKEADIYDLAKTRFDLQWHQFDAQAQQELQIDMRNFQIALADLADCCKGKPEDQYCKFLSDDNVEWVHKHQLDMRSSACEKHVWS